MIGQHHGGTSSSSGALPSWSCSLGVLNWDTLSAALRAADDRQSLRPARTPRLAATPARVAGRPRPPPQTQARQNPRRQPRLAAAAQPTRGAFSRHHERHRPSFDVVRVEPDGESVIAGRGPPGATIELLRNDQVHARAAADASGLFAFVPPPLPPGSHEVVLQSIAPDGTASTRGKASPSRSRKPDPGRSSR